MRSAQRLSSFRSHAARAEAPLYPLICASACSEAPLSSLIWPAACSGCRCILSVAPLCAQRAVVSSQLLRCVLRATAVTLTITPLSAQSHLPAPSESSFERKRREAPQLNNKRQAAYHEPARELLIPAMPTPRISSVSCRPLVLVILLGIVVVSCLLKTFRHSFVQKVISRRKDSNFFFHSKHT